MSFGINSAPEILQRKMHELIEGLIGVEVIADDFVELFEEKKLCLRIYWCVLV